MLQNLVPHVIALLFGLNYIGFGDAYIIGGSINSRPTTKKNFLPDNVDSFRYFVDRADQNVFSDINIGGSLQKRNGHLDDRVVSLNGDVSWNPFPRFRGSASCKLPQGLTRHQRVKHVIVNNALLLDSHARPAVESQGTESEHQVEPRTSLWGSEKRRELSHGCPREIVERDLGRNAFPRYVPEARCLPAQDSARSGCVSLRQDYTHLAQAGCSKGRALLVQKKVKLSIGCVREQRDPTWLTEPEPLELSLTHEPEIRESQKNGGTADALYNLPLLMDIGR